MPRRPPAEGGEEGEVSNRNQPRGRCNTTRIVAGQHISVSKNVLAANLVVEQIKAVSRLRLRLPTGFIIRRTAATLRTRLSCRTPHSPKICNNLVENVKPAQCYRSSSVARRLQANIEPRLKPARSWRNPARAQVAQPLSTR